jgi:Ni,Fe-hydrogenase maturation factor
VRDIAAVLGPRLGLVVAAEDEVAGLDLLPQLQGFVRVLIVDAFESNAEQPGTWRRIPRSGLGSARHFAGPHDVNLSTVLERSRRKVLPLPADDAIEIFDAVARDARSFVERLTPELDWAYRALVAEIAAAMTSAREPGPGRERQ